MGLTPDRVQVMERIQVMPGSVVLEHSFVCAALESGTRHHDVAADFLERMMVADTKLLFTDLLELQLHDRAFTAARRPVEATQHRASDRADLVRVFLARWRKVLGHSDAVHVEVSDLMDDVMYYGEHFRLPAIGAVHASLSMAAGADGLVTVDPAFGAVDRRCFRSSFRKRSLSTLGVTARRRVEGRPDRAAGV